MPNKVGTKLRATIFVKSCLELEFHAALLTLMLDYCDKVRLKVYAWSICSKRNTQDDNAMNIKGFSFIKTLYGVLEFKLSGYVMRTINYNGGGYGNTHTEYED